MQYRIIHQYSYIARLCISKSLYKSLAGGPSYGNNQPEVYYSLSQIASYCIKVFTSAIASYMTGRAYVGVVLINLVINELFNKQVN